MGGERVQGERAWGLLDENIGGNRGSNFCRRIVWEISRPVSRVVYLFCPRLVCLYVVWFVRFFKVAVYDGVCASNVRGG